MSSEKKHILSVHQNKIVFPEGLIPEHVEQFLCHVDADGRIVLAPLNAALKPAAEQPLTSDPQDLSEGLENVVDFRAARRRHQDRDKKKNATPSQPRRKPLPNASFSFVNLHLFSSRLEAEMLGEILKQAEIPYLIQSEDIGIFGPGASPAPGGVRMAVREADLEYARVLLAGLI